MLYSPILRYSHFALYLFVCYDNVRDVTDTIGFSLTTAASHYHTT